MVGSEACVAPGAGVWIDNQLEGLIYRPTARLSHSNIQWENESSTISFPVHVAASSAHILSRHCKLVSPTCHIVGALVAVPWLADPWSYPDDIPRMRNGRTVAICSKEWEMHVCGALRRRPFIGTDMEYRMGIWGYQ